MTAAEVEELQQIAPVACVQNAYNLAQRGDDDFIDALAEQGIFYVPFFPLGGFSPLAISAVDDVARKHGATSMQVALAWLLQRSPNILLIPGTSSVAHLEENLAAGRLPARRRGPRRPRQAGLIDPSRVDVDPRRTPSQKRSRRRRGRGRPSGSWASR